MYVQLIGPKTVILSEKPIVILRFNITGSLKQKVNHFVPYITKEIEE